jgi:hypothetical protein
MVPAWMLVFAMVETDYRSEEWCRRTKFEGLSQNLVLRRWFLTQDAGVFLARDCLIRLDSCFVSFRSDQWRSRFFPFCSYLLSNFGINAFTL